MAKSRESPRKRGSSSSLTPIGQEELRIKFLARLGSVEPFQQLFEHLPGIFFFIKNSRSELICASQSVLQRLNVTSDIAIVGTTDYNYFPQHIADAFVRDDQKVMQTEQPLLNHVETWYNEQRILDWFVTNKFPLRDRAGKVIGVIGTVQSYEGKRTAELPFAEIARAVEHIRTHLHDRISVEQLAELSGMSTRQLHRKFSEVFGLSVQQFLTRTRIQAASDTLVRTRQPIAQIAIDVGFCDQSAFTHQFRQKTGLTPRQFRHRYHQSAMLVPQSGGS